MGNRKQWCLVTLIFMTAVLAVLGFCSWLTYEIDPYFHFHAPRDGVSYVLNNERYQNNGILRNFDYELVITGSSMSSNFKASEAEQLFSQKAIKTSFRGASLKEVNDNMTAALGYNPELKTIIRPADGTQLLDPWDKMNYQLPEYLTDDSWLNDIYYLLNKDVFFENTLPVLKASRKQLPPTAFDDYGNWMWEYEFQFNREAVLSHYVRPEQAEKSIPLTGEEFEQARENIFKNLVSIAKEHPEQEFYYFFPPYSLCYFDKLVRSGTWEREIELYRLATELMLTQPNIHLSAFFLEHELIENFNNYTDVHHYSEDINSQLLRWIREGSHELTPETQQEYWDEVWAYYLNFDFDAALYSAS